MVDNRAYVFQTLSGIGYPVEYHYPAKFNNFPCISYFDSGHIPDDYEDGKATIDVTEFTVDVWEKADDSGNLIEIHQQVNAAMIAAGFFLSGFANDHENDTGIHHYTFKFTKPEEEV